MKITDFKGDIRELKEILNIINKSNKDKHSLKNQEENIKLFCEESDDEYLSMRRNAYIEELEIDKTFKKNFGYLNLENEEQLQKNILIIFVIFKEKILKIN